MWINKPSANYFLEIDVICSVGIYYEAIIHGFAIGNSSPIKLVCRVISLLCALQTLPVRNSVANSSVWAWARAQLQLIISCPLQTPPSLPLYPLGPPHQLRPMPGVKLHSPEALGINALWGHLGSVRDRGAG